MSESLKFKDELSFLFCLYQYTALISRAVDFHQMYFGSSVIGKSGTIDPEISQTFFWFSQSVKSHDIWRRFQHHLTLSAPRLKLQQVIGNLKQRYNATCRSMSSGLMKMCPRTHENTLPVVLHLGEHALNRQLFSRGLFDFSLILYWVYMHDTHFALKFEGEISYIDSSLHKRNIANVQG